MSENNNNNTGIYEAQCQQKCWISDAGSLEPLLLTDDNKYSNSLWRVFNITPTKMVNEILSI